ncbi:MAG: PAS domain S-box protein [Balneolaceae bacterium]
MINKQYIDLLLDQTKDLIWIVDHDFNLVYANNAYLKVMKEVTGAEKELNTSIFIEGFGEGYIQKWKAYYQRALAGEDFEIDEHYYNPESEDTQYGHVSFTAIRNDVGEVQSVACRSADITLSLEKTNRASLLMDASLDVFCTINEEGNFTYVSAQSESHWGYSPEELIGTPYVNYIVEEDIPKTNEIAAKIISGQNVTTFTNRYRRKDDRIAYNIWSARWDDETKTIHCVARDGREQIENERQLRLSEQRFKALVVEGGDLIGILDIQGLYTYVSPTSTSVLGFEPEEFIGRSPFDFIHPEDCERVQDCLEKIFISKKVKVEPFRFKNNRNQWRWIETVLTNMIDNPAVNGIVANSRDVTEKVEENHHLKLLQSVITNTKDAVLITEAEPFDEPGPRIIYVNEAFTEMTGYTAEEVIGKTPRILQGPNSNYEELARLGKKMRNWESCEATTINYKKNGEEFWINFKLTPVADETGWYTHWISIERDVTEEKNKELEKELLAQISLIFNEQESLSEMGFSVSKSITDFGKFDLAELWQPNLERNEMYLNEKYFPNKEDEQFYRYNDHLNHFKKSEGLQGKVWETGEQVLLKDMGGDSFLRKEAAKKIGLKSILGIPLLANNQVVGVLLIGSKRGPDHFDKFLPTLKRLENFIGAEIKRKRLETDLSRLFNSVPDLISTGDFGGRFLQINRAGCEILGYKEDEIIGQSFEKYIHPDDLAICYKELKSLEKGVSTFDFEVRFITKQNNIIWLSWFCTPNFNEGLIYSTAKNITEEKKLRELNRQVGELAKIGGWELELETMTPYFSEEVFKIYEIPFGSPPKLEDGIRFYAPEAQSIIQDAVYQCIENNIPYELELPFKTAKGKSIWVKTQGKAEVIDGKAVKLIGAIQDITDRKLAEIAVRESEELLEEVSSLAKIGSWEVDLRKNSIYWSNQVHQLHGTDPQSFVPDLETAINFYRKDFREMVNQSIAKAIKSRETWDFEAVIVDTKKQEKWVRAIGEPEFIDGECVRLFGSFQDIQSLKETESRLINLSENLPGVVYQYVINPDGTDDMRYVGGNVEEMWGFTADEVLENVGLIWQQIEAGGDLEIAKQSILNSIETQTRWNGRFRYLMPSGEIRVHLGNGTPSFLADGTIIFNSIILDITKEVKNKDLLKMATELSRIGSWEMDMVNQTDDRMFWSPMVREILEVDENYDANLTGGLEFYTGESNIRIKEAMAALIEKGAEFDEELLLVTAKGNERWIRAIGKSERVKNKCIKIYGSLQDIHESKILDLRLSDILGSISDAFYAIDKDLNFTYFNKEAERLLDRKEKEILGKNIWEVFPAAVDSPLSTIYQRVLETKVSESFEYLYPGDNSWYEVNAYASLDGLSVYFKNIDERIKAEQDLRKAFDEKQTILESIGDGFFSVKEDWTVTYWNKEAELLTGVTKEIIVGEDFWKIYADAVDTDFYNNYHRAMDTGQKVSFEEYYPTLDKWFEVNAYPTGEGLTAYFKDVSLRKKADIRLEEANERFQKVTEATSDAIWDWDIVNDKFYRSQNIEKFFGVDSSTDLSSQEFWNDSFYPDDINHIKQSLTEALEDKQRNKWEDEYRILNQEGNIVYVIDRGLILRDDSGNAIRMIGAMSDITDRKLAEMAVRESEEKLMATAERLLLATTSAKVGIWDWDVENDFLMWDDKMYQLYGIKKEEFEGAFAAWQSGLHPDDADRAYKEVNDALEGLRDFNTVFRVVWPDKTIHYLEGHAVVTRDKEGKALRMIGTNMDITELKRNQEELLAINQKLENQTIELQRSNEELEQFAFITSHDLQEPLRMISSFMDQLERKYSDQLDDKALQYIHFATDGAKRMKQIILDLLLYSRANRPSEEEESIDLNKIVSEFLQLRRKLISEKKAVVTFDKLPVLNTYEAPVTQIFHSLLDNALKYSREKVSPIINISIKETEMFYEFAIKDNGIGIDNEFYDKIFIIFQRLHNRKDYDGTGIGLSITKRAVEFLGGEIWVESVVGKGSTFYFTIQKK